jgi:acetyl/propionyl-CoA carboxylase alpha subunit
VYSEADADCLHVRYADEAVCIGPPPATQSYLVKPALIQAALQTGAQAIHPGYGFLAENAEFSGLCAEQGLKFIGPGPESIARMGDKASARTTMTAAGVPVTPGSKGVIADAAEAELVAKQIGLPVMVKAAAGGGGKGIRIVREASEVAGAVRQAQGEAEAAFGDGSVYVEKYLEAPRHIEIQVLADGHGRSSTWASGSARSSAATRRSSRSRRRWPSTPRSGTRWARRRWPWPGRRATSTPAPSSSCSPTTAASPSWR